MGNPVEADRDHTMTGGFHFLIAAQFFSALADNALLIITIALLTEQGFPAWWAPLLKFGFTLSYVLLAPVIGAAADSVPKARLMGWMNGLKLLAVIGLVGGMNPLLAYAVAGLGAAAYAPAKYGLLTELVPAPLLVRANGWLEVSVVGAALLGAVLGGVLVSPAVIQHLNSIALPSVGPISSALTPSLLALMSVYLASAWLTRHVPDSGVRYPALERHPGTLIRGFWQANLRLWRDAGGGRLSLTVTTLFWGVGATLQFAVLRWAGERLGLPLSQSAYLQASVAVGVVAGATLAGRCIPLHSARRVLPFGVLLGLLMAAVAHVDRLALAVGLLVLVGLVGGVLIVPLNALLQHRGCTLLSAGQSIAVQGFNENLSVLGMLAVYAGVLSFGVPIVPLMTVLGLAIAGVIGLLMLRGGRVG